MQNFILGGNHICIHLAMIKKQGVEEPSVADDCPNCWKGIKISQWAEYEYRQPVEKEYFLRVESDGEISMPADDDKATEVPAIKSGKGVHPEKRQGPLMGV
jgi:hypothetical protein